MDRSLNAYPEPELPEHLLRAPAEPVAYVAFCPPCDWSGPERAGNLAALRDYDRHAGLVRHALAVVTASAPPADDDGGG